MSNTDKWGKEWDSLMDNHVKENKRNMNKGKQLFIECFLAEANLYGYDKDNLISSLNTHLDNVNKELQ